MSRGPIREDLYGLALGAFATVSQVVLMREALTLSGGNELIVGLSFATWLVGVGVGALAAGLLRRPAPFRVGATLLAPLVIGAGLTLLRLYREVLDVPSGMEPPLSGLVTLLVVGVGAGGCTIGFLFTAAARVLDQRRSTPVSRFYVVEAVGALVAGLVFAFVLDGAVPHLTTVGLAGALPAAALASSRLGRKSLFASWALVLLIGGATLSGLLNRGDRFLGQRAFDLLGAASELIGTRESAYGRLTLGCSEGEYTLLADGRIDHSFPDPWGRPTPLHLALAQHPNPKRVLIIGGGPTDRVAAALAHHPELVVLTFIDEMTHDLCGPYWDAVTREALADKRVTIVRDDGRQYVVHVGEKFDVVFVAPRPPRSAQANRYHTLEFFRAVHRVLAPGGTVTVLAPGGANVLAPEAARAAASELATVRAVFPEVVIVPGLELVLHAASRWGVLARDPALLRSRYEERGVIVSSFSSRRFENLLDSDRIADVERQLAGWPATVNTDSRPFVYLAALQLWERGLGGIQRAGGTTWTGLAERSAWAWLAIPLGFALIWLWLSRRRRRGIEATALFAIACTGAAGMAAEIMVLYVFQAASGRLYTGLAVLVALFMAGLACGALLGRKFFSAGTLRDSLVVESAMLVFLVVSGPLLSSAHNSAPLVTGWSLVAGLVTGGAFPALLGRAASTRGADERIAAAGIEAADHFGAAFGALVTGVIWIPVFGVTITCLLFAALKGASLVAIWLFGRSPVEHR